MSQSAEDSCGYHGTKNGKPVFDYTCDDCMLPATHYDPPELNAIVSGDDNTDTTERIRQNKPAKKNRGADFGNPF
jgi:hypothetical protein